MSILHRQPSGNLRRWTKLAIYCLNRKCICEDCYYQDFFSDQSECQMKSAVLGLVRLRGLPKEKGDQTMTNAFIMHKNYFECIETLNKKDQLNTYRAIANFAFNDIDTTDLTGNAKVIYEMAKTTISIGE